MTTNDDPRARAPHVTLRCGFCLALNRIELARAPDRPKCGKCGRPMLLDRPVKIDEADFEATVLETEAPVLVDFYADWCGPCRMVAPVLDEIAREHQGRLVVVKLDTDRAPTVSQRFGIRSIPTLILFRAGEEAERIVGFDPNGLKRAAASAVGAA